jgi:hypothetical protein
MSEFFREHWFVLGPFGAVLAYSFLAKIFSSSRKQVDPKQGEIKSEVSTPRTLRLARHIVAMAIVLLAQSPAMISANGFLVSWLGSLIFILLCSAVVSALYYLYFTLHAQAHIVTFVVSCAWLLTALYLFGQWSHIWSARVVS